MRGRLAAVVPLAAAAVAASLGGAAGARASGWHGDYFPNVVLTTHEGKKVRFYDDVIKGKVVSLNFIYTRCGDVCPLDTAQLRQVQQLLGDRVGRSIFMYSISIDPENDTPAALKRYMRQFDVGPGWTFLTGRRADIELIQRKLGIRIADPKNVKDHDTRLMLGNEAVSHWVKRSPYDDPTVLANLLAGSLQNFAGDTVGTLAPYEQAGEIKGVTRGRDLFKTRCSACHTIGGGDRLGPDLAGVVAARPREWLVRWLKEPDKMLAEKDPLALELRAKYRNLPMPNLSLNDVDAAALIDYMEKQDARPSGSEAADGPPAQ